MKSLCLLLLVVSVSAFPIDIKSSRNISQGSVELELLPKHFLLHPGEQIHYTVLQRMERDQARFVDATFSVTDATILRPIESAGVFEAMAPGRTELLVRTPASNQQKVVIEVSGHAQSPMMAVPYNALREIVANDLLF